MQTYDCVIVAADGLGMSETLRLVERIGDRVYGIKLHDLFDRYGRKVVYNIKGASPCRVWLDMKLNDTPDTVAKRAKALRDCGADIITAHASGDTRMMKAALQPDLEVFAVTVLTSISEERCRKIFGQTLLQAVASLANLARDAGVHGLVLSAEEVSFVREHLGGSGLKLVVPGIRSAGEKTHDQKRVGTPAGTLRAGADYLVMGRQITLADDPSEALDRIQREIEEV